MSMPNTAPPTAPADHINPPVRMLLELMDIHDPSPTFSYVDTESDLAVWYENRDAGVRDASGGLGKEGARSLHAYVDKWLFGDSTEGERGGLVTALLPLARKSGSGCGLGDRKGKGRILGRLLEEECHKAILVSSDKEGEQKRQGQAKDEDVPPIEVLKNEEDDETTDTESVE
ncbi:hypothetical protein EDB85DRAFT_1887185 [Lactarius pseudohatsudake]|nr:hypothetical protein EDB85DRAFT_1887185 [Lactarius pseudohatsudake]